MADRAVNLETVIGMVNTYFRNVLNLNPDLLIDGIVSLPTVDAVPVVHGQWVIGDDGALHCSKCSRIPINRIVVHGIQIFDMVPVKETMKYCPNCGAKMDGKDGEHHDTV